MWQLPGSDSPISWSLQVITQGSGSKAHTCWTHAVWHIAWEFSELHSWSVLKSVTARADCVFWVGVRITPNPSSHGAEIGASRPFFPPSLFLLSVFSAPPLYPFAGMATTSSTVFAPSFPSPHLKVPNAYFPSSSAIYIIVISGDSGISLMIKKKSRHLNVKHDLNTSRLSLSKSGGLIHLKEKSTF